MTTRPMLSAPSLVLTIGSSMLPAMADVKRIYLQSDPRRAEISHFLVMNLAPRKDEAGWIALDDALRLKGAACSWKQAREKAGNSCDQLKAGIQSSLHELRSHEKLIEVGLGGKSALPLDVFLVADISESDASALLTVMPVIQSLLADEPYAELHVLLNIAVFDESPLLHANRQVTLDHLLAILKSQEQVRIPQIYLFDRFKEGVWEAQDALEVQTILGNFLLALLSGGLAQNIAHQLPQTDVENYHAYFCGASAAAAVLDMAQLQIACALRLGEEIIENEFHSKVDPNPGPINELAGNFLADHADPRLWGQRLCRDGLFRMRADGLELHISDLKFEDVLMEGWRKTIQAWDDTFKDRHMPAQRELMNRNAVDLEQEFKQQLEIFAQWLPQQVRLYPGGIRSARLILEQVRHAIAGVSSDGRDAGEIEKEWNEKVKAGLEELEHAIQLLPKPPRWISRLPVLLKRPLVQLFNLIYLHRELGTITELRQICVRSLEQKYAALMDVMIARIVMELNGKWIAALDKHIRAVKRLQSNLDAIQSRLKEEMSEGSSASSLFRLSAMNEILLSWAYYSGKRPQDGFRHALLIERDFLKDWQKKNRKKLQEQLMDFCQDIYRTLSDVDLEEVLAHSNGKDNGELAVALSQGAIPLLRPNFDQTGSGPSYQMRFFLSRDPRQSSLLPIIREDMQDWQEIVTGDPFTAICCRVRVMIPCSALTQVLEHGRHVIEGMDDETRKGYSLPEAK